MNCFLRTNSEEIRNLLKEAGISVCACADFPISEWLVYSIPSSSVHGVFPAEGDDYEVFFFGDKNNFKEIFLRDHENYVDCGEDVELFIKTINS